ncbi:MAG: hypothetical protein ACR2JE_12265 [Acidobacteriaceae bacterium]
MTKTKTTKKAVEPEKRVVQTVKLGQDLFVRLKTYSAVTRQSNQQILETALEEYLDSNGG